MNYHNLMVNDGLLKSFNKILTNSLTKSKIYDIIYMIENIKIRSDSMIKKIVVFALVMVMCLSTVAFAQTEEIKFEPGDFIKTGEYILDGEINWKIHAGNKDTAAEFKQLIEGEGKLHKIDTVDVSIGNITIQDHIEWATYENTYKNLMVLTMIKLTMSPMKQVYKEDESGQFYMSRLIPSPGSDAYLKYAFTATHGKKVANTFSIDYESLIKDGQTRRYIDLSGIKSKTNYFDDLEVKGSALVKEALTLYDEKTALGTAVKNWFDLF
jgi:hypothetical protein